MVKNTMGTKLPPKLEQEMEFINHHLPTIKICTHQSPLTISFISEVTDAVRGWQAVATRLHIPSREIQAFAGRFSITSVS